MQFKELTFHPAIAAAIATCGYTTPTPIQARAIPLLLAGRDLLGLAQTGTGKTAAFVLPTLQRLQQRRGTGRQIRSLILAPTRELAEQIHDNIGQMAGRTGLRSCTIYGGVSKTRQLAQLRRGADIVVACPGRLLDHLNSRAIDLSHVEILILDEADQMFDKGFLPDIRRILGQVPRHRQSMVFSATMPREIRHLAEEILTDHETVQVDHEKPAATISHVQFRVSQAKKTALLKSILREKEMATTLVFTRTKFKAKNLARQLQKAGFRATSLQGNMSQNQRRIAMDGFRSGRFNILVATDIAARGIDVSGISHVVNYDIPDTVEAYTHRTGRTGRAERAGKAFSFVTAADSRLIRTVERTLGKKIRQEIPEGFDCGPDAFPPPQRRNQASRRPARSYGKPSGRRGKSSSGRKRTPSFDFGLTGSAKECTPA